MAEDDGAVPGSLDAFEARLKVLRDRVASGFPDRARELEDAIRLDDDRVCEAVRRLAHKLRGTAGSHGFDSLTAPAAECESVARAGDPSEARRTAQRLVDAIRAVAGTQHVPSVPEAPAPTPAKAGRALEGLRVLAADDDDATRRLLELTLTKLGGARASMFPNGAPLVEAIAAEPIIDLLVVDAMMPGMNGLEVLRACAERGLLARIRRVVVLSAASLDELGWSFPDGLATGWLRKPFRPAELLDALLADLGR